MPDRSFEQQVREELADLQMQPDAASWEVVVASLQKERKRRWILWLLILVICCGGSGLWWELQTKRPHHLSMTNKQHEIVHEQRSGKEEVTVNKRADEAKEASQEVSNMQQESARLVVATNRVGQAHMPVKEEGPATVSKESPVNGQAEHGSEMEKQVTLTATVLPETVIDSSQQQKHTATITPTAAKEKLLTKANKKWQVNLFVNAGSSGVRNSILRTHAASADMYYNQSSSGSVANGSATPAPPLFHDAFSFNLGVEFNKAIGHKNQLGISIGYGLYQDRLDIGMRKDSTIKSAQNGRYSNTGGYYYKNTDSIGYTNHYHFLEAAVHLYTPFRLFRVLPFRWELGAGAGILLGSNGLHYDQKDNLLFHNNELLRKLNWQLSTGLDIGIGKRPSLYIGPQIKFFITNLSEQEGTRQYLLQPSMRAVYQLP